MNTRQYYEQSANIFLNGSLIALLPIIVVIFPLYFFYLKKGILLFSLPFFIYSFISFFQYTTDKRRSLHVYPTTREMENLNDNQNLLLFLPSPTVYLQLYHPKGECIGEIRDQFFWKIRWFLPYYVDKIFPRRLDYFDGKGNKLATFIYKKKTIEIVFRKKTVKLMKGDYQSYKLISEDHYTFIQVVREKLFLDIRFQLYDKREIARVRSGWMPLEWDKYFKNPNTPILTLENHLPIELELAIYALLGELFRHYNH